MPREALSMGIYGASQYMGIYIYIYENHRQRVKSLRVVVENSARNQFSYFYVLNPFLYICLCMQWFGFVLYFCEYKFDQIREATYY